MRQAATQELTDGELYYIIENGIRFTGMPAFGEESAGMGDEESWALVTFIRHLPTITDEEVEAMKKMDPKSPAELEKEESIRKFLKETTLRRQNMHTNTIINETVGAVDDRPLSLECGIAGGHRPPLQFRNKVYLRI